MKRIIAFSGSNSQNSINQQLIHWVASEINGAEVEVISLLDYDAPLYGVDAEQANGIPANIQLLFDKISTADGFVVSTPEHNGFMPAVFKNTIDWLSRMGRKVFNDKPVVFLSASPGARGGVSALGQLLGIMPHQGAVVVGGHGVGKFYDKFENGVLTDAQDAAEIKKLVKALVRAINEAD